jgi:hypothetical protein
MTSFSYTLVLSDSEIIMLQAALEMMIKHCDRELAGGPAAPFIAWQISASDVLARLHHDPQLRSYSTFGDDT